MNQNQQNQNSRFQEVGGYDKGTAWDPRAKQENNFTFIPGSPNNHIEGYLHSTRQVPNRSGGLSTIWCIQVVNSDGTLGEIFDIFGDTVLNDRLQRTPMQAYICLEYKGRQHKKNMSGPWSQTNSYHVWFVGVDGNVMPMAQVIATKGVRMPPKAAQAQTAPAPQQWQQPGYQPPVPGQQFQAPPPFPHTPAHQFQPPAPTPVPPQQQQQWAPPPTAIPAPQYQPPPTPQPQWPQAPLPPAQGQQFNPGHVQPPPPAPAPQYQPPPPAPQQQQSAGFGLPPGAQPFTENLPF